jgi:hypothetical protein
MSHNTPISFGPSPFAVLQSIAQATAAVTQSKQMANISQDLTNQLNRQLAALQPATDRVSIDLSQNRINQLQAQQKTISSLETQFGTNGSLLADMTNQLNLMTQAIANSDGTSFDNALSALSTDLDDITPPAWNPIFQTDGTTQLKNAGITIQSSATYDLTTPAGQAAATADVTALQNTLQTVLAVNGANQTVAASQLTALNGQISSLQSLQYQQQTAASQAVAQQTARLQQNMQNQLHLIQLNLGKSSQIATALSAALNPPKPVNSVYGALSNAIGESAATAETQLGQNPAIMSLFA